MRPGALDSTIIGPMESGGRSVLSVLLRRRGALLAITLVLLLVLAPRINPGPLARSLETAEHAARGGRPAEALAALEAALAFEPSLSSLHLRAAEAALLAGDPAAAQFHLDALPPAEDDAQRTCLRFETWFASGQTHLALSTLPELPPDCVPTYDRLAPTIEVRLAQGEAATALQLLNAWLAFQPAQADARALRGLILATTEPNAAIDDLRAAMELAEATDPLVREVLQAIESARAEESRAYSLALVGQVFAQRARWILARLAFQAAVAEDPDYIEAVAYLGLAKDQSGGDGLQELLAAVEAAPDAALPHYFLGVHWYAQEDLPQALVHLERAANLDPANPAIAAQAGAVYAALGRIPEAKAAYRAAVEIDPRDPDFWLLLAQFSLNYEVEVDTLAVPAARNALSLQPENPAAADALGYAHYLLGDLELSERFLNTALELDAERPSTWFHLGLLRTAQGDLAQAVESLERAIQLDPAGPVAQLARRTLELLSR